MNAPTLNITASSPVLPDPDTYRGWLLSYDYPPIPVRDFDWSATHPDYDGAEDANDNRLVHGRTREAVIEAIDDWHNEQEEFRP